MAKTGLNFNRWFRRINRKYKDALFRRCFENKKDLLELYNALNGTAYDDINELAVTTLDDCIYLTYKNDLSFIISATLNLYEHQSTYNPNMPIRGLIYFARLYEAYIKAHLLSIYGKTLVTLPEPRYVVFYNGKDDEPDRTELRLSDAFETKDGRLAGTPALECVAVMLNINYGHNKELMEKCKRLHDYAYFVNEVNKNLYNGHSYEKSVEYAMKQCESEDILTDIVAKQRSEVFNLLLNEFDKKKYERTLRFEGRMEGRAEGKAEFIIEMLEEIGEPSEALKDLIMEQTNIEVLRNWRRAASRAKSVEDFEQVLGLVK